MRNTYLIKFYENVRSFTKTEIRKIMRNTYLWKFTEKRIEILSKISRKFWRKLTEIFDVFLEQRDVFLTIFRKQKVSETSGTKNK